MAIKENFPYIPADVVATIEKCAKTVRMPLEEAEQLFVSHFEQESLDFIVDPIQRYHYAIKLLKDELTPSKFIKGYPVKYNVDFSVLDFTSSHEQITKKGKPALIASVFGVFAVSEDNEASAPPSIPLFGILTLWGEACKILDHLKRGGMYKLLLLIKTRNNRFELSTSHYEIPEEIDAILPEPKDIVTKAFEPILPSEAGRHLGNNKLIHGRVIKYHTKLTQNDKRMGITEISDVNVSLVNNILLSILWFNEPDFAERYKVGSICYFLVDIDIKETGYIGLSVIGTCVIPVLLMDDIDFYDDQELSEWL